MPSTKVTKPDWSEIHSSKMPSLSKVLDGDNRSAGTSSECESRTSLEQSLRFLDDVQRQARKIMSSASCFSVLLFLDGLDGTSVSVIQRNGTTEILDGRPGHVFLPPHKNKLHIRHSCSQASILYAMRHSQHHTSGVRPQLCRGPQPDGIGVLRHAGSWQTGR